MRRPRKFSAGKVEILLRETHDVRLASIARGEWPLESIAAWRELASAAAEIHGPIDDRLERALEVTAADDTARARWENLAAEAAQRRSAGLGPTDAQERAIAELERRVKFEAAAA